MDFAKLLPSKDLAKDGAWLTYTPPTASSESFDVLVGYGVQAYQEEVERRFIATRRENDGRNLSTAQQIAIRHRARYNTMVRGWRGLQSAGQDLPFTEDNLYALLSNYLPFETWLLEQALDVRNLQTQPAPAPATDNPEGAATSQAEDLKSGGAVDGQHV